MSRRIDELSYNEGWNARGEEIEHLGQEVDRWQIIARDLIQDYAPQYKHCPTWVRSVIDELEDMPEMRFKWSS